jgi:hypothetical protein
MEKPLGVYATRENKEEVAKRIVKARDLNIEEQILMTIYSIKSYLGSLFKFGISSKAARDALRVKREFIRILKEEDAIFRFLLLNIDVINPDDISRIVDMLDEVNEDTVMYYYQVLDDIDDAVEIGDETRAKRRNKDFDTLIESKSYRQEVMMLVESTKSLQEFLGYPQEFWDYIKDVHDTIKMSDEAADHQPFIKITVNENGNAKTIYKMLCPEPTDFYTALIAIKVYAQAYEIYKSFGKKAPLLAPEKIEELKLKYEEHLNKKAKREIK